MDRPRTARALVALLLLAGTLRAQLPDGWYAVASFTPNNPATAPGTGGVFFVHPRTPGVVVPVTGLPPDVATPAPFVGADAILRLPGGDLVVNGYGAFGAPVHLYVLTLAGSAVTGTQTFDLGLYISGLGNPQNALLPNGDILVAVDGVGVSPEPLAGQILGRVSPASGTIVAVPVAPPPAGAINALAVDPSGATAFLGMVSSPDSSAVYSVPVAGGAPALVATLPSAVSGLDFRSGSLLLAACNIVAPFLFEIDLAPNPATVTPVTTTTGAIQAIDVETATGNHAIAAARTGTPANAVHWMTPAGAATFLTTGPPGGWGIAGGIAIDPNPEEYGTATPGTFSYSWTLAPNPGGLPTVGNAAFGLTVGATGPSAAGLYAASLGSASLSNFGGFGFTLLLDPAQVLFLLPHAGAIPLPIPNDPALAGARVFFQSFHADAGAPLGVAATRGLEASVL
ncbi:MAG: hypothetical protein L0323_20480 [Planctomycetes bacterium]|nr:hypothetical protein [Planctomycetota bacterium]